MRTKEKIQTSIQYQGDNSHFTPYKNQGENSNFTPYKYQGENSNFTPYKNQCRKFKLHSL